MSETDNEKAMTPPAAEATGPAAAPQAKASEEEKSEQSPAVEEPSEAENADASSEDSDDSASASSRPSAAPELPEGEMTFAELFAQAEKQAAEKKKAQKASKAPAERGEIFQGQVLEARVVGFSHDSIFVDVGGKAEGVVSKSEFEEEGELKVKEGDKIEARVLSVDGAQVRLGKVLPHQSGKNREAIRQSFETGIPIEGKITGQNKGGLDVSIGGLRAFLPSSQIDLRPVDNPASMIGQKAYFRITEFKDNGRNIVVSRRAILAEERKRKADEVLATLEVGKEVEGTVTTLKDYGAFVDLGGVEGLVHVSELSHGRISKPSDLLNVGQTIRVRVLKIEDAKKGKKISLSVKALEEDPWDRARATLKEGEKVKGKVVRIQPFGAFVEVLPGVEGLIHVSNLSTESVRDPGKVVKEGDEVEATVISTDWNKRRVGLSLVKTKQELANELGVGSVHEASVEKIEGFGIFVKLPSGARALVPSAETGTQRGADLTKEFQTGQTVKVSVLDIEQKSGKIRCSIRRAAEAEERAEYKKYMQGEKSKGFGTFGDLFKGIGDKQ